jgi:SnoaL-like domain
MDAQDRAADETTGRQLVTELFARVRRGDASAADLFTDDGVITGPGGYEVVGRDAIRQHYERNIAQHGPQPEIETLLAEPPWYVTVLKVGLRDGGANRALDLFEVTADGITRLELWTQRG